ncbi:MAG: hypothetical protein HRT74_00715 [Flavobacteriales bacterium]|nr:hypothetical protein [Flavobacteriales bacterium]
MRKILFTFILAVGVLLFGCTKKEINPNQIGDTTFFIHGEADNSPFIVEAGRDNYILNATYRRNKYGVLEYEACFEQLQGDSEFRIYLMDDDRSEFHNPQIDIDAALTQGSYQFQTQEYALDSLTLQLFTNDQPNYEYNWVINGQQYSGASPVVQFGNFESLDAKLTVSSEELQCSDSLTQTHVLFDANYIYYPFYSEPFSFERLDNSGLVKFSYNGENDNEVVSSIEYQVNDNGNTFIYDTKEFQHQFSSAGPHEVIMIVQLQTIDSEQYTFRYAEKIMATEDDGCAVQIVYEPLPLNYDLSKIRIEYIDQFGDLWSSLHTENSGETLFHIISVENAEPNLKGDLAKGMQVEFDCTLINTNNPQETMELEGMEAYIAVSYPQ